MYRGATFALFCAIAFGVQAAHADEDWPGAPPDCWAAPRLVQRAPSAADPGERNIRMERHKSTAPAGGGEYSPNKAYFYRAQGDGPGARLVIFAEKDHLLEVSFKDLFTLSDMRWVNEKLLFLRAWWGRIEASDVILDVEREAIVYVESVTDAAVAMQQYRESCPLVGTCRCIAKR